MNQQYSCTRCCKRSDVSGFGLRENGSRFKTCLRCRTAKSASIVKDDDSVTQFYDFDKFLNHVKISKDTVNCQLSIDFAAIIGNINLDDLSTDTDSNKIDEEDDSEEKLFDDFCSTFDELELNWNNGFGRNTRKKDGLSNTFAQDSLGNWVPVNQNLPRVMDPNQRQKLLQAGKKRKFDIPNYQTNKLNDIQVEAVNQLIREKIIVPLSINSGYKFIITNSSSSTAGISKHYLCFQMAHKKENGPPVTDKEINNHKQYDCKSNVTVRYFPETDKVLIRYFHIHHPRLTSTGNSLTAEIELKIYEILGLNPTISLIDIINELSVTFPEARRISQKSMINCIKRSSTKFFLPKHVNGINGTKPNESGHITPDAMSKETSFETRRLRIRKRLEVEYKALNSLQPLIKAYERLIEISARSTSKEELEYLQGFPFLLSSGSNLLHTLVHLSKLINILSESPDGSKDVMKTWRAPKYSKVSTEFHLKALNFAEFIVKEGVN